MRNTGLHSVFSRNVAKGDPPAKLVDEDQLLALNQTDRSSSLINLDNESNSIQPTLETTQIVTMQPNHHNHRLKWS